MGVAGYFIVGMVLRKFIFHKEGSDIVPQKEFWMAFPFLIKVNGAGPLSFSGQGRIQDVVKGDGCHNQYKIYFIKIMSIKFYIITLLLNKHKSYAWIVQLHVRTGEWIQAKNLTWVTL